MHVLKYKIDDKEKEWNFQTDTTEHNPPLLQRPSTFRLIEYVVVG